MVLLSSMIDYMGQGDPHACRGLSWAPRRKHRRARRHKHNYGEQMDGVVWQRGRGRGREGEVSGLTVPEKGGVD